MGAKLAHRHNRHIIHLHIALRINKGRLPILRNQLLVGIVFGK